MYLTEKFWTYVLGILIVFFLGLAGTSIGHIITYWRISNDWLYPEILAIENAIGIISSILLSFHESSRLRNLGISIFLATFFVELAGNVFYYYITIDPQSDRFIALAALTRPIFDPNNIVVSFNDSLRSWTAFIQGFWLPLTHVCVFASIAILIEKQYKKKNSVENPEGESTVKSDDGEIQPDLQTQEVEIEEEENTLSSTDDIIDFLNDENTPDNEKVEKKEKTKDEEMEAVLNDASGSGKKKILPVEKASFLSKIWKLKK